MNTVNANLMCKCGSVLQLGQQTRHAFGLEGQHVMVAVELAGAYLGWRKTMGDAGRFFCPRCSYEHQLRCKRCLVRCPDCSCVGGPRIEALLP